jgi:hypothetical protein
MRRLASIRGGFRRGTLLAPAGGIRSAHGILCLIALPSPALAEVASRESHLRALFSAEESRSGGPRARLLLQAIAEAGRAGQASSGRLEQGLGIELSWARDACGELLLGGQARAYTENGHRGYSGEQWLTLCVTLGSRAIELRHHLEWEVQPALSAARRMLPRPYRREAVELVERFLEHEAPGARLELMQFSLALTWIAQAQAPESIDASLRLLPLAIRRGDLRVELLEIAARTSIGESEERLAAMTVELHPIKARAAALGGRSLVLDIDVAYTMGRLDRVMSTEPPLALNALTGELALGLGPSRRHARIGARRTLFPTLDQRLALEDRAYAELRLSSDPVETWAVLALRAFVARTQLAPRPAGAREEVTAGGALDFGYYLTRSLRIGFSAEIARSFYAQLGDDALPQAQLAARGLFVVDMGARTR